MSEQLHKNHSGFAGGTLVHTENGLVAIKNIKVGERVLTRRNNDEALSYQTVSKVVESKDKPIYYISIENRLDDDFDIIEYLKNPTGELDKEALPVLVTEDHPFWVEGKGWVAVESLESGDVLLDNQEKKFTLKHPGYDGDVRAKVYKTAHPNIGFLPNYGLEYSVDGSYIDLTSGKEIQDDALQRNAENDPTLAKLYQNNPEWEQDLREELEVPEGEPAEFFGFKTGEWVDPSSIGTDTLATTTVYNLEVENTHTYFVGEEGILVSGLQP